MTKQFPIFEVQDLGDAGETIRTIDGVGPSGIEVLMPNEDSSHLDALEEIREIIEEHYGEQLSNIGEDGEKVVIERLVAPSDELPYIEYTVVNERSK